jgi:glycosyltransferase involved in cell wall biosynthesis
MVYTSTGKTIALVLTSKAMGGMEMRSLRMAKLFAERGYEMHYGCPPGSKLAMEGRRSGVRIFECHIHGSLDLWTGFNLARFLRKNKIQIVMAFSGSDYWMTLLSARLASIPVVLSRSTATRLNPVTAWVSSRADRLVTVAQSIKETLVGQGIPAAKIEVIYNGVDTDKFSSEHLPPREVIRSKFGMPADKFVIGCLGRVEKGQHILLSLYPELAGRCPNLHYFFAGQHIPQRLQPLIEASPDLTSRTTLSELIDFEDVPAVLHALDAVVMLPETEPFSNAVIEAMAMEKPLILSRTFGNVEAVEDGVSGLLVDITDQTAIADAVCRLYHDPQGQRAMGLAAAKRARRLFSQDAMLDGYEGLWHRLIGPSTLDHLG